MYMYVVIRWHFWLWNKCGGCLLTYSAFQYPVCLSCLCDKSIQICTCKWKKPQYSCTVCICAQCITTYGVWWLTFFLSLLTIVQAQQSTGSLSSSPERHMGSYQAGNAGYFGGAQQPTMPSPPYTPYDSSPQQSSQYNSPCVSGTNLHDYQGFTPAPLSTPVGYPPQNQQPLNAACTYPDGQYMQQCQESPQYFTEQVHCTADLTGQSSQFASLNPNFEMQTTVFTTSPNSSTLCYQPPNLTDLQLPQEQAAYHMTPNPNSAHPRTVDRRYINDARARYHQVACPVPGAHPMRRAGAGVIDNSSNQARSISQWSQWLQGGAPQAHVY